MQVFKAFLKTEKKFLPSTILYFVIFSAIAFMATYFDSKPENSSFQTTALEIGVIDEDGSDVSTALKEYLSTMHTLTPLENEKEVLLDRLFYRSSDYVLSLPKGFEENFEYETVQIPGIYTSAFIDRQINSYLKTLKCYLSGGFSLDEAIQKTDASLAAAANQVEILKNQTENETSSNLNSLFYYYQFLPYVLLSMILTGLTPILTTFSEKNLAKRISCSSTSLFSRNLQLALGSIVFCLFVWLLFLLASGIFYGDSILTKQGMLCVGNSFLLLPLGVSISLILSCFSPSTNVVSMVTNVVCLGMSFLCGVFIPQQLLGKEVLAFSKFLPVYWQINNNDFISSSVNEMLDMAKYWKNIGIQALYIGALFSIALVLSKIKNAKQKEV